MSGINHRGYPEGMTRHFGVLAGGGGQILAAKGGPDAKAELSL